MILAVRFGVGDGNAHAEAGFDAADGAIEQEEAAGGFEASAKAGADPEDVFRFDEHAAQADVAGASGETCSAPLDLEGSVEAESRRAAAIVAGPQWQGRGHGEGGLLNQAMRPVSGRRERE